MQINQVRFRRAILRACLAFTLAFGGFFGVFSLGITGILLTLFVLEQDNTIIGFPEYVMSNGYHMLYFAVAATAFVLGALWFVATLISNLRYNEGVTNQLIDRWTKTLDRSDCGN